MFTLSIAWWELVIRSVAVYGFLLVFLRLTGRRQTGQYAPFDLVLLLVLSNAVQNSMNGGDNSLAGGLISAATLLACHAIVAQLSYRNHRLARLIDGAPQVLIHEGRVDETLMRRELLTPDDVKAALRAAGCLHARDVQMATIETNGQITVVPRNRAADANPPNPA